MQSDSLAANKFYTADRAMDLAWNKVITNHPKSEGFYYVHPDLSKATSAIDITVYPTAGQFYNSQGYTFDRHTLAPLKREDVYSRSFEASGVGGKLRKMNYDIHVGSILGFPGKVLAFLATLIGASLPVTGFLVWYGRKFKKKKTAKVVDTRESLNPSIRRRLSRTKQEEPVLAMNAALQPLTAAPVKDS
jgi:uncharacterized iron-regulated membrane protein